MKKITFYLIAGALALGGAVSCEDTVVDWDSEKDNMFADILYPYVTKTVIPTYKGMADYAIEMADACDAIYEAYSEGNLTTTEIKAAGAAWNNCRDYWEKSEAFLYGAAADCNIDPHIDSWPLDKNSLDTQLENITTGGQSWDVSLLGYGLLGFHAVEYMLYELSADGKESLPHSTDYEEEELMYLCAVAGDLRDQCVYLYASWAGMDGLESKYTDILEAAELEPSYDYGYGMINAGKAGSRYVSLAAAVSDLVQGMADIADEVGNTKIGNPNTGGNEENRNYIESPYSLNSINDFIGNIISIRNCYTGNSETDDYIGVYTGSDVSMSDYVRKVNPDLDAQVKAKIAESIEAIGKIGEPFISTASSEEATAAVRIVGTELKGLLDKVYTTISE